MSTSLIFLSFFYIDDISVTVVYLRYLSTESIYDAYRIYRIYRIYRTYGRGED